MSTTSITVVGFPLPAVGEQTIVNGVTCFSPHSVIEQNGSVVSSTNPLNVNDSNSAGFQGVVVVNPGTSTTPLRSLGYICTASGNITITFPDASTLTLPITASTAFQTLPFATSLVTLGTGTAASFWNLK